jgi:uncharacterized protein YecE (DUF72 family)
VPSNRLRVGCSGWNYASWRGRFYPRDLPAAKWLHYYATVFNTVEINNTFYRLPEAATFAGWRSQTPAPFLMAVKASRFLTHLKRLREPVDPLRRLFARASNLGPRLGPVLYQLPPTLKIDLVRLEGFLTALPTRLKGTGHGSRVLKHVIEFRHPTWYVSETFQLLAQHRVALCLHDKADSSIAEPIVGPFVYLRFHGPTGRYGGSYDDRVLEVWARRCAEQLRDGRHVFAYFNNDVNAAAPRNALSLRDRIAAGG